MTRIEVLTYSQNDVIAFMKYLKDIVNNFDELYRFIDSITITKRGDRYEIHSFMFRFREKLTDSGLVSRLTSQILYYIKMYYIYRKLYETHYNVAILEYRRRKRSRLLYRVIFTTFNYFKDVLKMTVGDIITVIHDERLCISL